MSVIDIATRSFDIMQGAIARQKLAAYPPDCTIEISKKICGTFDFYKAAELIELGYTKAEAALESLIRN